MGRLGCADWCAMKRYLVALVLGALAWHGYQKFIAHRAAIEESTEPRVASTAVERESKSASPFSCDGRTSCAQMTSCEEAVYFIRHCPATKMDGDGDGVPC